jgi:hypothetical protein
MRLATSPEEAIPADIEDLYFLYSRARVTAAVSILEFGSGWSTWALALALAENRASFDEHLTLSRHPNAFQLLTIDADAHWQSVAMDRLSLEQQEIVESQVSKVEPAADHGIGASRFTDVPLFFPDLIYLDAPDPMQIHGMKDQSALQAENPPVLVNPIDIDSQLWPGCEIVIDGRTSNARYLASHLNSNFWTFHHDAFLDRSYLSKSHLSLGMRSREHLNSRLKIAEEIKRGFGSHAMNQIR